MEENTITPGKVGLKWGVIFGVILIIYNTIILITEQISQALNWLPLFIFIPFCILAHNAFKKEGDGFMSYGQGLGIGVILAIVAFLLSSIFSVIYTNIIDPEYPERIQEKVINQLEERGLTDEQIEAALGFAEIFQNPILVIIFGLVFGVFFTFIFTLIISAITKKSNPEPMME